jgi:F-box and WD-40 domain protein 1/11
MGRLVITASRDRTLRVWNMDTGLEQRQLLGHLGSVNSIAAIDKNRLASASMDATIKIWNLEGECLHTIDAQQGLAVVKFNGEHLYSGGLNGKINMWDVETGVCVHTFIGHVGMIRSIDCIEVKKRIVCIE